MATRSFLRSRRQPRLETDYSRKSSIEVKNEWSYFSTPPYAFIACRGTALALTVFTATSLSALNWERSVVETRWTKHSVLFSCEQCNFWEHDGLSDLLHLQTGLVWIA